MRHIHGALLIALAGLPGYLSAAQSPSNQELSRQIDSLERRVQRLERAEKKETRQEQREEARAKARAKEKAGQAK